MADLHIISTLCLLIVGSYAAAIPKCHTELLNTCMEPVAEYRKGMGQKFPTKEGQVVALCKKLDEANACADKYKRQCMSPLQLQLIEFVAEGALEVYKDFCTPGSDIRTDYLKSADCMSSAYQSEEFKNLSTYVEAALEKLMEVPMTEKLSMACCGFTWMDKNSKELGEQKCGKEAVDSFMKVMAMATSNLPEVMCQGSDPEGEKCRKMLPPEGAQPKGTLKNSHIGKAFAELYLN